MICNSLGSNFTTFSEASRSLGISNDPKYRKQLTTFLANKYQGKVELLYKGREALELALKLANLPKGSYVAINGFTCIALYKAITNQGLQVAYIDIEEGTLNFSAQSLAHICKTNTKIKAVIIQNSLGFTGDIRAIHKVCKKEHILLIEDLAHSIGAHYSTGEETGTVGDFVVLSFSQDKVIDSVSGGALIIRNEKFLLGKAIIEIEPVAHSIQLRDRLHPLLTWIIRSTYDLQVGKILHYLATKLHLLARPMEDLGKGFHQLPSWQCELALSQLKQLPTIIKHRQRIAAMYANHLPQQTLVQSFTKQLAQSSCLRFPLLVRDSTKLLALLKKHNFYLADIWYDAPIAPAKYTHLTSYAHECPNAEKMITYLFNLPTHRSMNQHYAKELVELVKICQK